MVAILLIKIDAILCYEIRMGLKIIIIWELKGLFLLQVPLDS